MRTETITWNELPADGVPDADTTVLVAFKFNDEPEVDTWPGWWDGEHWMDATTGDRMERHGDRKVLAWADMPAGGADQMREYARAALAQTDAEPVAEVYPPDGTASPFTVINLGAGRVQMGDSIHDGRLPALWFGKNGQGMGHEEEMNREAREGETLAVVTFANVEGLDVLVDVIQRIRRVSFPDAATTAQPAPPPAPVAFDADGFHAFVTRELPDDTIIGKSKWWADHLTKCVQWFVKPAAAPLPAREPVACVTECEACFTPDACQLRGTCDHYAASQLRIAPTAQPAPPTFSDATILPDGSAFATASWPLPKDHWLYAPRGEWDNKRDEYAECPEPILNNSHKQAVRAAIKYAVRGATMCGQEMDFDPDAMVQNAVYALCGPANAAVLPVDAQPAPPDFSLTNEGKTGLRLVRKALSDYPYDDRHYREAVVPALNALDALEALEALEAPLPAREPLTEAQAERLYRNLKPSAQQDARSCAGFKRLVRIVEAAHNITATPAAKEQP